MSDSGLAHAKWISLKSSEKLEKLSRASRLRWVCEEWQVPNLERSSRKVRVGKVVSNKMDQTVTVAIESRRRHPIYKKSVKHISKIKAHDPTNSCNIGDFVNLVETRPLSKTKRWRVTEILSRDSPTQTQDNQPDQISVIGEINDLGETDNDENNTDLKEYI